MTDISKYDSVFCKSKDPYSTVEWIETTSKITNSKGETIFELAGIEAPKNWSQMAINVVASKYFYPGKEKSIRQIIDRVAKTIAKYGLEDGYFDNKTSADNFYRDLAWLMLHQHGSFNSPVWFNLGIAESYPDVVKPSDKAGFCYDQATDSIQPVTKTYEKPQVSACFIQSVKDDMGSIMDLAKSEALLFKNGSGTGTDLSSLRSSKEEVSGGGAASGPLSFLRIFDTIAGVIRSAGRIRRSAKLNVLSVSHPDIKEWIFAKVDEEKKAKALIDAGYSAAFGGEAYGSVAFQNANLSVKITDDFMDAVKKDKKWTTKLVSNPKKAGPVYKAAEIFNWIAECAHKCGDPGVQFNDTMNQWHTCSVSGSIATTNPCGEFAFIDNSACNLASLNLLKFRTEKDGQPDFDFGRFKSAATVFALAQDIIVDRASYPTEEIARNSHDFRPLGLGYANLGALIMSYGVSYGSDVGRELAGVISSALTAYAYDTSAAIAKIKGSFKHFDINKKDMLKVLKLHRKYAYKLHGKSHSTILDIWDSVIDRVESTGVRNAQVTLLAPTGCVVGDTLISSENGINKISELGDVNGNKWQDINLNVLTDKYIRQADKFYINGWKQVITVKTKAGFELTGTPNHRIKIINDKGDYVWCRLDQLLPQYIIPIQIGSCNTAVIPHYLIANGHNVPKCMSVKLAELLGMYYANGYIHACSRNVCIFVDNKDVDVIDYLVKIVKELFNVTAKLESRQGCIRVRIFSQEVVDWFYANKFNKAKGNHGEGAKSVCIPIQIRQASNEVLAGFIRGYFQCDGSISNCNNSSCSVELSSVSKTLITQMQVSLLNLGIVARLRVDNVRKTSKGKRPIYVLRISSVKYADYFKRRIGFIGARKNDKFKLTAKVKDTRHTITSAALIKDFYASSLGLPYKVRQDISARVRAGVLNVEYTRRLIYNYPILGKSKLGKLVANNWYFDALDSLEAGEASTYDLSVPEGNTYIANGFINHNTIGFMMDCDTTGVEPDIALVKYKNLSGGGNVQLVNQTVPLALSTLGYDQEQIKLLAEHIITTGTIEDSTILKDEHLPVFDCALKPGKGKRFLKWEDHVLMMAAIQPFLSGAISKTVNIPADATVDTIKEIYTLAWKEGIKGIAVYRDGCKGAQPINTGSGAASKPVDLDKRKTRQRLPVTRKAVTHKFNIAGHEGYLTVGFYPDGTPGELFIVMSKEGSTIGGIMDAFGTAVSMCLQYGVPLKTLINKFMLTRFEPAGFTGNEDIPMATSIIDYLFRWLDVNFVKKTGAVIDIAPESIKEVISGTPAVNMSDSKICDNCGSVTIRNGTCFKCPNCGSSLGCS